MMNGKRVISRRGILAGMAGASMSGVGRGAEDRPLAERLAEYALAVRFEDLDGATVERVKSHVVDTLGCGIAALEERTVRVCREVAKGGQGEATLLGTREKTSAEMAAFANGAAVRYYDLNDFYNGTITTHPSDHIAPCLAVGEAVGARGRELITAIVTAYEINCRMADALDIFTRGWDTPVYSLPAVALGCGKLMGLDAGKMREAVSLAINDHISMAQTRTQALSDWKGLADGEASRNAVFAAKLARAGITGPAPIFEGRLGFFKQVSGEGNVEVGKFGGKGNAFRIQRCGMKAFPAVVYCQTSIVAAQAVAGEILKGAADRGAALERVVSIEVATSRRGLTQTGMDREKWTPTTRDTADHSMPYLVARAMWDGEITNASYTAEKMKDKRVLAWMKKIQVVEDRAFTARTGDTPTRITATLEDGRRVSREVGDIPGFAGKPMGREDVERKFRINAGGRWGAKKTDGVLGALWRLEETRDIGGLVAGMAV